MTSMAKNARDVAYGAAGYVAGLFKDKKNGMQDGKIANIYPGPRPGTFIDENGQVLVRDPKTGNLVNENSIGSLVNVGAPLIIGGIIAGKLAYDISTKIGKDPNEKSNKITPSSVNFALNAANAGLDGRTGEGTETNAYRHVLWQAMIALEVGFMEAQAVGLGHENPDFILNTPIDIDNKDLKYNSLQEADYVADTLNNRIGRNLGSEFEGATRVELAKEVLKQFKDSGFYTVLKNKDGSYSTKLTKISEYKYKKIINYFNKNNIQESGMSYEKHHKFIEVENFI